MSEQTIEVGDTVRLRGGKVRWVVVDIVGDRAWLESDYSTADAARVSDLSLVSKGVPNE
jgi:uncharacterized protein YraI